MTASHIVRWLAWAALAGLAAWIVLTRLTLSYDLAYFLPAPVTPSQHVLIDRVGQGPGSRTLFVTLPGASPEQRDDVGVALAGLAEVRSVLPQAVAPGLESIPEPVLEHRYLLADVDTSAAGLRRALQARLRDLSLVDDPGFLELIAADPHLASLEVLERLAVGPEDAQAYRLDDGTPFLLLETRPPAFDLTAQQALVAAVRDSIAATAPGVEPVLYGAGAYGISLQQAVRREATFFSLAAAAALAVLLGLAYRSMRAVLLSSLPLVAGALAGLAALALLFPRVHGITLAFGFTLMGVTVDYALHVQSHLRGGGRPGLARVGPTLALSVVSTTLAFLAFTLSGSKGLVQLGVFSATGILTAALCAWLVLPSLSRGLPGRHGESDGGGESPVETRLRFWPLLAALAGGGALLATQEQIWSDDLSSLTPVAPDLLAVDRQLRQRTGAPDLRYLVVNRGGQMVDVLASVSELETRLAEARADGLVDGYQTVTALVPDPDTQRRRRAALAPDGLARRLEEAARGLAFQPAALRPFLEDVQRTAAGDELISPEAYADSALAGLVEAMLYRDDGGWVALTFLVGLEDSRALQTRLESLPNTALVDLQTASRSLLATYRVRLLQILAGALAMITIVLVLGTGAWVRVAWVMGTVLAAVLVATGIVSRLIGSLSLFDLVATALVAGLGLDYALFLSRDHGRRRDYLDTAHAVTVCFASTALVFGLLAASDVPVLHGIGLTVAVGVVAAYTLAFTASRPRPAQARPGT